MLLVIRLLAILASVGGPLYVFDLAKWNLGTGPAFIACFLPIGFMVLGSLSFDESRLSRIGTPLIRLGQLGMWALFGMNVFTFAQLATGHTPADLNLIVFGIVTGCVACAAYAVRAHRFLMRRTA